MTGLTSISFRDKTVVEIIQLCVETQTECIEWGGDIHVPPGNYELAKRVGEMTRAAGIVTPSYGSYYRVLDSQCQTAENSTAKFTEVAKTAVALGASLVRIWLPEALAVGSLADTLEASITELKLICSIATDHGLAVGMEYHRNTLTETKETTLALLQEVAAPNLYTYWQMNPDISHQERLAEIELLAPYICMVHAFYWRKGNIRHPLMAGKEMWMEYRATLAGSLDSADLTSVAGASASECNFGSLTGQCTLGENLDYLASCPTGICPAIIEFVKGDSFQQYREDIAVLGELWR